MHANEKKLEKWEKKLVKAGLLTMGEHIIDVIAGDYYKSGLQIRGHIVYTNDKLVFCGRLMKYITLVEYHLIHSIKPCFIGPFFPLGMDIVASDSQSGANERYVFSVFHRKHWIEFIESKR